MKTCSGTCPDINTCTNCKSGSERVLDVGNNCVCDTGFYSIFNLPAKDPDCEKCLLGCKSCDDGVKCTACLDEPALSNNNRVDDKDNACPCKPGFIAKDPLSPLCSDCHYTCSTCSGSNEN